MWDYLCHDGLGKVFPVATVDEGAASVAARLAAAAATDKTLMKFIINVYLGIKMFGLLFYLVTQIYIR